jgi:hypothetical protein
MEKPPPLPPALRKITAMVIWEGACSAKALGIDLYESVRLLAFNQGIDHDFAKYAYYYALTQGPQHESAASLLIMRRWIGDERRVMTKRFDRNDRRFLTTVSDQLTNDLTQLISGPQFAARVSSQEQLWADLTKSVPPEHWSWNTQLPRLYGETVTAQCFWCLELITFYTADHGKLITCPSCKRPTAALFWWYQGGD